QKNGIQILSGNNTYSGDTTVAGGILRAGVSNAFSPFAAVIVDSGATLDANGFNQTISALDNSGTVNLASANAAAMPGVKLIVSGDYTGNGGTVVLATQWLDDSAAHDQLVIQGNASGVTALQVLHRGGGAGAQTTVGIDLVSVGGVSAAGAFTLSPASDGYRATTGAIAAGPYDYALVRGGNGGYANDWYLVSTFIGLPEERSYRPEVGAYLTNRYAAIGSQWHTLRDRQHQGQSQDDASNQDAHGFIRLEGREARLESDNFRSTDRRTLLHLGGDAARWNTGAEGSLRVGVMAMLAYDWGTTRAAGRNDAARQSADGASGGLYATWYERDTQLGAYADFWVIGGRFNNKVEGPGLPKEKYRATVWTASLEAGYGLPLYQDAAGNRAVLQPQAQIIASSYRTGKHEEKGGTVVADMNDQIITTRLGVRLYGEIARSADEHKTRLRPYAELNWWRGPDSQQMAFDGIKVRENLATNRAEIKLGIEGNLTKDITISAYAGAQSSLDGGYASKFVNVGFNKRW
ncbi:MAG: autotransporter outer membrane beta-barrel domain-containing protein, partial [Azonexus sp.]|nr:autotransporter outer membrane beta-barrel domain-containing protein [Azonexus sp.]